MTRASAISSGVPKEIPSETTAREGYMPQARPNMLLTRAMDLLEDIECRAIPHGRVALGCY